ncbi:glutaredoxin-like protein NrdH [Aerococcus sanguinicola]|uniref:Glutaredoxin-like protein NrdH n=1 Tax=Aerococcus sanguinicola TaxID=119206 RepID=A0A0X8FCW3_9LACT|nr:MULTISPECIES: glutaredoxin-like protein NrdH [Aerococcus]AMB94819.1 NrdH-redoxin [Aerococcus sanguinicola]MDK7049592.1 glutaredoxin-like protein NrdH [Aerococcus sanguinicola]OFT96121.1 NrdH-redoxin [Aerococcus sp. HMSC23C02]PKZ23178.1 glutaredoxin-like protein NrdH [Aerococcus sanguinicola]
MVKVYSKPNCMQCKFTKKFLDEHGVAFEMIDVTESEAALEEVKALGFQALPVIVADGQEPFYGFRPDILAKFA